MKIYTQCRAWAMHFTFTSIMHYIDTFACTNFCAIVEDTKFNMSNTKNKMVSFGKRLSVMIYI